jgi:hypothetical protein
VNAGNVNARNKENLLNLTHHCKVLIAGLGLALFAGACQSSQNQPGPNAQPAAAVSSAVSAKPPAPPPWPPAEGGEVWHSTTTGKDYRVKIEGKKLYAEWVDLSQVAAQNRAYIHTECVRKGSKWVGNSDIFLPCTEGSGAQEHIANTCHLTLKVEIDSISKKMIKGRGQSLHKFDCGGCKVVETGWGSFDWVPMPPAQPSSAAAKP